MDFTGCDYQGERVAHRIEGNGTFSMPNGNRYVGEFRDGMFHGKGCIHFPNGGRLEGQFKEGVLLEGKYIFRDGLEYKEAGWTYCLRPGDAGAPTPADRRFYHEIQAAGKQSDQSVKKDPTDGLGCYQGTAADGVRPSLPASSTPAKR